MTTKTKNNKVSEEFKTKIENIFSDLLSVGVCYEDLIIKDNTSDNQFNINSWVNAYNEYGVSTMTRAWYDEINKPNYDLKEFNYFGVSGTFFAIKYAYYRSKLIKNKKIKWLLRKCKDVTLMADAYIVEIDSKIYTYIDAYK